MIQLNDYPETGKKIHDFYLDIMLVGLEDSKLPDDFKNDMRSKGVDMETIEKLIVSNPRILFDFFDANDLYVNTVVGFETVDNVATWRIEIDSVVSAKTYPSRKLAEADAIIESVKIMEGRLTK